MILLDPPDGRTSTTMCVQMEDFFMDENRYGLTKEWVDYWKLKGYNVCLETGTFSDNEYFPGLQEFLDAARPGETFFMPPQFVLYYRRKGYRITGSFEWFAVVHHA
jgi:hypothetical protein